MTSPLLALSTAGFALGAVVGAGRGELATGAVVGGVAGAALGMMFAAPSIGGGGGGGGAGGGGKPPAGGGGYGGADPFVTDPADAVHDSGWSPIYLADGRMVEVMRLPLLDERSGLFARLTYADARDLAAAWGLNMWTMELGRAVWAQGARLRPCKLVRTAEDTYRMRSREFCERHDRCVRAQLVADAWSGQTPCANAGKDLLAGALPGWAFNGGWFEGPDGTPVQQGAPGQKTHGETHTDYSQLTRFWRA